MNMWISILYHSLSELPHDLDQTLLVVIIVIDDSYQCPLTPVLDQTQQVRSRTLARGEVSPCSLLSQLWPAASSPASHWGTGQTGQATNRCLDS